MRAQGEDDLAELLRREMAERGLSQRALAKLLAGSTEHRAIERWRRPLSRYLDGGLPTDRLATIIEKRLDYPAGSLPRLPAGRRESGAVPTRAALAESQAKLQATVDQILASLEALELRVAALEPRRARTAGRTVRAGTPQ